MLTQQDIKIVTQVAFKEAAAKTSLEDLETTTFLDRLSFLTDALLAEVTSQLAKVEAPVAAPVAAPAMAAAAVGAAFPGATEVGGDFQVSVKGQQHGPIPAWLHEEARAAGISEVWDNRDRLQENNKRPWFRATSGDKAFWPPRNR
jgi:hypothetical protein